MRTYKCLKKQIYQSGEYTLVPIRDEDKYLIMKWRNEQMFHLRQKEKLTSEKQEIYFKNVISALFRSEYPEQILFSLLYKGELIAYGGLVHIDWTNRRAEVSFLMDTEIEKKEFESLWTIYLGLIKEVAFSDLLFIKVFTYAYDLRPQLYPVLLKNDFQEEARLRKHFLHERSFVDVLIHSCLNILTYRKVNNGDKDLLYKWASDPLSRKSSLDSKPITLKEHENWFKLKMLDSSYYMFIFKLYSNSVGLLRLESRNSEFLLSFLVDPSFRGKGIGFSIIKESIKIAADINKTARIKAVIKKSNPASISIFKKAGFVKDSDDKETEIFFYYHK